MRDAERQKAAVATLTLKHHSPHKWAGLRLVHQLQGRCPPLFPLHRQTHTHTYTSVKKKENQVQTFELLSYKHQSFYQPAQCATTLSLYKLIQQKGAKKSVCHGRNSNFDLPHGHVHYAHAHAHTRPSHFIISKHSLFPNRFSLFCVTTRCASAKNPPATTLTQAGF